MRPIAFHLRLTEQREAHEREMAEQFRLEQIRKEQEEEREVGHNF